MSYVIKAALSNSRHPEYGQVTVAFPIPNDQYDQTIEMLQAIEMGLSVDRDCTVDESERTLLRVGITDRYDIQVRLDFDELPEKVADALDLDHLSGDDIPALDRMCRAIAHLGEADMEKLNAVVLMARPEDADEICRLAENLDLFDYIPGVQTLEDYGIYMIRESGHFEYDENLEGFYDYRLYGERHTQQEGGQFNEYGYVAYHGVAPLEELMRSDPAEQQHQGPQMGGLS